MRKRTLLIVMLSCCSSTWLGCNSATYQPEPVTVYDDDDARCQPANQFTLQSPAAQPIQPSSQPPLFYDDVLNVFTSDKYNCSTCHQAQYQNPDEVKRKWVRVYAALESGYMPAGFDRVTSEDLQTLKSWEEAGFPNTASDLKPIPENCSK